MSLRPRAAHAWLCCCALLTLAACEGTATGEGGWVAKAPLGDSALCDSPRCDVSGCSGDAQCVTLSTGESYCSPPCSTDAECPNAYTCKDATAALAGRCVPRAGTCQPWGRGCGGAGGVQCFGAAPVCSTPFGQGGAVCTQACASDSDCPAGYKHCALDAAGQRVCQRRPDLSADTCGGPGAASELGSACQAGSCSHLSQATSCVSAGGGVSFCSHACVADADCGAGAYCGALPGDDARVCVPYSCACRAAEADPTRSLLRSGLAASGRDACLLGQRPQTLVSLWGAALGDDPFRLPAFNRVYQSPFSVPHFLDEVKAQASGAPSARRALELAAQLGSEGAGPLPTVDAPSGETFEEAVLRFHEEVSEQDRASLRAEIDAASGALPTELKRRLLPVLQAMLKAAALRQEAISFIAGHPDEQRRFFRATLGMFHSRDAAGARPVDLSQPLDRQFLELRFGYGKMVLAARLVAQAVETSGLATYRSTQAFAFNHPTPLGRLVVSDAGNQRYTADDAAYAGPLALLVDVGGDDVYELPVGANSAVENPVSVAIDLRGADLYTYPKAPHRLDTAGRLPSDRAGRSAAGKSLSEAFRQGGGNLGVGLLFDFGSSNDRYESLRFSQGSGVLGVGVLFDAGGDDTYLAEAASQGAGLFGVGLLVDAAGRDTYQGYSAMQGSAYVKGVGVLLDHAGDDTYFVQMGDRYQGEEALLPTDDPLYGHGNSQGAAWGRRADHPIDGLQNQRHASGGVGLLVDRRGNDHYACSSMCQGSGYWFGLGALVDQEGDDTYDGRTYVQGAAVHYGLGLFEDSAGDDSYNERSWRLGMGMGFAHDISVAWHQDLGGDDTYLGSWQAFGVGSNHSLGVFINSGGDDRYTQLNKLGFGMATGGEKVTDPTNFRYPLHTAGLFVDHLGQDTYSRAGGFTPDPLGNGAEWTQPVMETSYGTPLPGSAPHAYSYGVDQD